MGIHTHLGHVCVYKLNLGTNATILFWHVIYVHSSASHARPLIPAILTFCIQEQDEHSSEGRSADSYNWGAHVKIDGKEVAVVDFLGDTMQADNMKKNLE